MEIVSKIDKNLVIHFLEDVRDAIKELQVSKGIKASGKSAEMLAIREDGKTFQLIDVAGYFEQQERGKKKGVTPVQVIYEWLGLKKYGIQYETNKERERIAYAIVANHKKYGSFIYRSKRVTGVLSEAINNEMIDRFIDNFFDSKATEILSDVVSVFKRAA